jgi:serine/threonine-protein kinase
MDDPVPPGPPSPPTQPGAAEEVDLTGRTLGEFHLLRRLGAGGMGQVYLAEQRSLKREVALKILKPELAASPTALQRFRTEAEAVARVTHANIVQVFAFGEAEGVQYMALEYVRGTNLRDYLNRKGPPELPVALSLMRQMAAALQRAGELGVVHRDIKPENILLTRKGEVKVADFGLSRCYTPEGQPVHLTQSGVTLGTPLYMSPEQVQGQPVDTRSDIYSLGVTYYALLAGHPPFKGQTAFEVALQHVQAEPPSLAGVRPDLPPELCGLVHKMIAKRPEDRHQTAREVLRDLARVRVAAGPWPAALSLPPDSVSDAGPAGLTTLPLASRPALGPVRRRRWPAGLLLLALGMTAAAAAGAGLHWWQTRRDGAEPTPSPGQPADQAIPPPSDADDLLRIIKEREQHPNKWTHALILKEGTARGLSLLKEDPGRAERFFRELSQPAMPADFQTLGKIGQALGLSRKDQAQESTQQFADVFQPGPPRRPPRERPDLVAVFASVELREAVESALTRNAENLREGLKPNPAAQRNLLWFHNSPWSRRATPEPGERPATSKPNK